VRNDLCKQLHRVISRASSRSFQASKQILLGPIYANRCCFECWIILSILILPVNISTKIMQWKSHYCVLTHTHVAWHTVVLFRTGYTYLVSFANISIQVTHSDVWYSQHKALHCILTLYTNMQYIHIYILYSALPSGTNEKEIIKNTCMIWDQTHYTQNKCYKYPVLPEVLCSKNEQLNNKISCQ
jgi:hypothetical protein